MVWKQWLAVKLLVVSISALANPVHQIQRLLGYGGAIPSLQNFLIAGNPEQIALAQVDIEQAIKIAEAHADSNTNAARVLITLQAYQRALPVALELRQEGLSPQQIQQRLQLSDTDALQALIRWQQQIDSENRTGGWVSIFVSVLAVLIITVLLTLLFKRRDYPQILRDSRQVRRSLNHLDRTLTGISDLKDTEGMGFFEVAGEQINHATSATRLMRADTPPQTLEQLLQLFPEPACHDLAHAIYQVQQLQVPLAIDIKSAQSRYRISLEPITGSDQILGLIQLLVPISRKELESAQKTTMQIASDRAGRIKRLTAGLRSAKEQLASLEKAAHKDPLTDLYNRLGFGERLRAEVQRARRKDQTLGVLMVDVDRFKAVNDTYGHAVGDQALKLIADTLQRLVRSEGGDIVGRLGGDEFIVVLADASAEHANRTLKMARTLLADEPIPQCPDESIRVDISGGAVTLNPARDEPGEVIKLADAALYRAKEQRSKQAS